MLQRVLFALLLCACAPDSERAPEEPPAVGPTALECVATYVNPSLDEGGARAAEVIGAALDDAGIFWISAGSAGFSVNVDVLDAQRAREIVRAAIEEHGLAAQVHSAPR